ncbi:TonB-dependent receptor [Bacteroides sp. 214]|uniref:TonB-dependent receptor n=1 Tax=Bacteroides sp. 214 TaxID=2302935 RepID=UPI0013D5D3DF|nr:TonB-dependent receptor [Bacteroides sp. 214]NDW11285.1 TonB-dependent receptor [Bacteroides sp. 214]
MRKQILLATAIIALFFSQVATAQETTIATDTICVEQWVKNIAKESSQQIYAVIDSSFYVRNISAGQDVLQLLKESFANTPYKVSVYNNAIFILKDKELTTHFSPIFLTDKKEATDEEQRMYKSIIVEKATSENKVYIIGDAYARHKPENVTLSGKVTDFKSGEPLIGVNIVLANPWTATVTDVNGNFTITLPAGRVQLDITGMNIKNSRRQLLLHTDGVLDIEMEEESHWLSEVLVVSGRIQNVKGTQMGLEKLQVAKIKNIPMALGEVDILKAIQALPGVKTVGEASSGFNVRGGATDQNLILLNDGTIYNPNHLFGFFAAFSSDMIKEAEIYKSSIPAQYGGRISSVLDIKGKEANKEKFIGSAGIGLVTSKLNLEIPLIKERTSLLLSGRTTYSDWILNQLPEKSGYKNGKAGFYDLGATFSHNVNAKNNLNVYGYYSRDNFSFNKDQKYAYSNINASAKWRTVFNERLAGYFSAGYDHYDYQNKETTNEAAAYKLSFDINQFFVKTDFSYDLDKHKVNFGLKSMFYNINAGTYEPEGDQSLVRKDVLQKDKALETAIYIGDEWEINNKLSVNAGIRYSIFNALGPRTYYKYQSGLLPYESTVTDTVTAGSGKVLKTYHAPEFRLSVRYAFSEDFSIKAGFNSMQQYIHKLSNTAIMSPTDTWKLSDANIKPQKGWQTAIGAYYNTPDEIWEFSIEGYYKKMNDYLDYRNKAKIIMNHHIETDVISTEGYSYGVEFMVRKAVGKLNGWLGYTYSRTFLRQSSKLIENPVNNGKWYPTEYDKPHEVKFVGNYKFTERYSMSVNVDYSTGRPTTVPAGQYYDHRLNSVHVYYTDRNSYRIPDYFRTDISFNIEPSHKLTLLTHSSVSIGVYNVTARKNVYSIYFLTESGKLQGYKMSIFGSAIPFITYNIKF